MLPHYSMARRHLQQGKCRAPDGGQGLCSRGLCDEVRMFELAAMRSASSGPAEPAVLSYRSVLSGAVGASLGCGGDAARMC